MVMPCGLTFLPGPLPLCLQLGCSPISCPQVLNQHLDALGGCYSVLGGFSGSWDISVCNIGCRNLGSYRSPHVGVCFL